MDRRQHKGRQDGAPEALGAASFPAGGRGGYTVEPAWIDTAGRTRTWVLRDPSLGRMAEIATKRDAEKMAGLLNRLLQHPSARDDLQNASFPRGVDSLYRKAHETTAQRPEPAEQRAATPTQIAFRHDAGGHGAREAMDKALDALADQLDTGRSEAMTRYLFTMSRFRSYSWGNVLLIHVQCPEATRVAGFNTWKKMGRCVKKGEHGIMILAPCGSGRTVAEKTEGSGEEGEGTDPQRGNAVRFRPVYVFDVSQTDGEDLPEPQRVSGQPGDHIDRLEKFAREELGIVLDYVDNIGGAYGASMGGAIQVLKHLDPAQRFSVLCHEIAHEILHWTATEEVRKDKTLVETQAEAVAFTVCHAIGLENATAAAADYIGLYRGSRETLRQSLAAIHQAAGRILEAVS